MLVRPHPGASQQWRARARTKRSVATDTARARFLGIRPASRSPMTSALNRAADSRLVDARNRSPFTGRVPLAQLGQTLSAIWKGGSFSLDPIARRMSDRKAVESLMPGSPWSVFSASRAARANAKSSPVSSSKRSLNRSRSGSTGSVGDIPGLRPAHRRSTSRTRFPIARDRNSASVFASAARVSSRAADQQICPSRSASRIRGSRSSASAARRRSASSLAPMPSTRSTYSAIEANPA